MGNMTISQSDLSLCQLGKCEKVFISPSFLPTQFANNEYRVMGNGKWKICTDDSQLGKRFRRKNLLNVESSPN